MRVVFEVCMGNIYNVCARIDELSDEGVAFEKHTVVKMGARHSGSSVLTLTRCTSLWRYDPLRS